MRYDFNKMDSDSFELMIRSLNEKMFGIKCEQYGLGPDGQREFTFEGNLVDSAGTAFNGRTIGQVKYKYLTTKTDDYTWLTQQISGELKRFREQDKEYLPDNYLFYTNVVLTPAKDTGLKDKIDEYVKSNNDIIEHFYVKGYDEICALLDNNRDVATAYAGHVLSGDVLMPLLDENSTDSDWLKKYLYREFEEDMYTRMEQAGSATEKKISIEKVCVDINVLDREYRKKMKFAKHIFELGNQILGYKKPECENELDREENFVLIGGPGHGKSTICQFIAQIYRMHYLQNENYTSQPLVEFSGEIQRNYKYKLNRYRIPFKIVLREYAAWINRQTGRNISVIQFMRERIRKIEGDEVPLKTLRRLLIDFAWIFFFDGLDEVPESSNRKEVLKQLHIFITIELKETACDCIIISTTRAQGYNHDFNEKNYKHVEVAEFSKNDCCKYIQKLFDVMEEQTERREEYVRIMKEALEDDITSRLMKTPLQATIISILVKSGGKPPHERYSLFHQYYDTVIKREKQKDIITTLNLSTDWLDKLHYLIGYQLQCESEKEENASAEISRNRLEETIQQYVNENKDDDYEAQYDSVGKTADFLLIITQRICFLCENRDGFYSFQIRSMQEYFAGTYLVKDRNDKESMANIKQICYSSYWRNALLFALGYIEMERKYMEPEISELCEQMNGIDNIIREDYTAENLCLFGSWLALDILAEDIFHGKPQAKYIVLASKVISLNNCANYHNFRQLTGVQRDKLLRYVKENYSASENGLEQELQLFIKINENTKNNLEGEIISILRQLTQERCIKFCIDILVNAVSISDTMITLTSGWIENALEEGNIKFFLPYEVLNMLLCSKSKKRSTKLKKMLFIQGLFCNDGHISKVKKWDAVGIQCDIKKMLTYLAPFTHQTFADQFNITDSISITIRNMEIDKISLKKIQTEIKNLDLTYLSEFCDFLLEPTFVKYQKLGILLSSEEPYLAKEYENQLHYYIGNESICTKEEFQSVILMQESDHTKFIKKDFNELFFRKTNVLFNCFFGMNNFLFDELIETGPVSVHKMEALNTFFLDSYVIAAEIQLEYTDKVSDISDKTAERFAGLICAASRRKYCSQFLIPIMAVLMQSRFKKILRSYNPDLEYVSTIIDTTLISKTIKLMKIVCIQLAELKNIIGNIIGKVVYDAKESAYLSIIPLIINDTIDLKDCILESTMQELAQLNCDAEINYLTIKLLQMCTGKNEQPNSILEDILKINLPNDLIFTELYNMLHHCIVENKDKILVSMYLKLENENFENCEQLKQDIFDDMMEEKCAVATVAFHN